ncbi:hypothetical protein FT643_02620 [Ketobacter sp. MCCC 1A13808]|uniref:hypothetical protein n=1 Tax=Ketobacter sp. MCCC 1A13808 TaxID=2602738 RepID=UPI000F1D29B5|nr:hypothetical protein [Ketobacter sp. MCCC 1A13808]MVF11028.1 hypothetical protein [Ketobacter sp. MCCC 1A13808]RLP56412.1 MAG: hypothetical protein D6160_03215 [Ketobacter sp.]
MTELAVSIIATALLSSFFTLGLAQYIFNKRLKHRLENELSEAIARIKAEVGPEVEARVKKGVMEGFKSLPSREVLRDTTRSIAKTGLDIMGDGLKMATRPRTTTKGQPKPGRRPGATPLDEDN